MEGVERSVPVNMPKYDCLLFDLDDTLYPLSAGLQLRCRANIEEYMHDVLGIEDDQVPYMCVDLYKSHGTTMAGLKVLGYEFDNDDFHSYVHGRLPYESLRPDPVLRSLLLSMPQRKIVFTNSDRVHCLKALGRLGLEDCFKGIICFETLNPSSKLVESSEEDVIIDRNEEVIIESNGKDVSSDNFDTCADECHHELSNNELSELEGFILCKPSIKAMEVALKIANVDPKRALFFDDSVRNIASGKAAGLNCVLVGNSVRTEGADFALESIHNIKEAIPEIWEGEVMTESEVTHGVGIETLVIA